MQLYIILECMYTGLKQSYSSLSKWNFVFKCPNLKEHSNFAPVQFPQPNRTAFITNSRLITTSSFRVPFLWFCWTKVKFRKKSHRSSSTFWKTKPNWLHQFKSVDPKRKINEHFGVSPSGTVYSRNYDFRSVNVSVSLRSTSCKIPFNFTVDGCSAQAYFLNALAVLIPSPCIP